MLIFVPLLYVVAIGLLVYGYLHRKGAHFTEDAGKFYLEGEYTIPSVVQPVSALHRLQVHMALASLVFTPHHVAQVLLVDGTTRDLHLQGYEVLDMEEGIFRLKFDYDVSVLLRTLPDGVAIESAAPHKALGVQALILPFFPKTDEVVADADQVMMVVGEQQFVMQAQNKNSSVSIADRTLTIFTINNEEFDEIIFSNNLFGAIRSFGLWLTDGIEERLTDETYAPILERYLNTSLTDFSLRFNSSTGLWANANGEETFSEAALMTMLMRGQQEKNFTEVLELLARAKVDKSAQLPISTSVYLGGMNTLAATHRSNSSARIQSFNASVGRGDRTIFANRWLMRDLFLDNSPQYSAVLSLAQASNPNDTVDILIGKMVFLLDSVREQPSAASVAAIREHLRRVQQSIVWLRRGLYILENDRLQFELMVQLGGLLVELSQDSLFNRDAELFKAMGYDLIANALRFADMRGALPRFALWNNGVPRRSADLALVEELFPWLTQRRLYPRLALPNAAQRRAVYSASHGSVVLSTPEANTMALSMVHPVGYTHQFMLQQPPAVVIGVQVGNVTLSRVNGNLDNVEQGWNYDTATRTLYVKMVQRSEREQVRVSLQPPPPPPPPRPEPGTTPSEPNAPVVTPPVVVPPVVEEPPRRRPR